MAGDCVENKEIGLSGTPKDRLSFVSRLLTPEYFSLVCKFNFGITEKPGVQSINKYSGFNFSYPRLAIVGGEQDLASVLRWPLSR
jgi:hypothetical protein